MNLYVVWDCGSEPCPHGWGTLPLVSDKGMYSAVMEAQIRRRHCTGRPGQGIGGGVYVTQYKMLGSGPKALLILFYGLRGYQGHARRPSVTTDAIDSDALVHVWFECYATIQCVFVPIRAIVLHVCIHYFRLVGLFG